MTRDDLEAGSGQARTAAGPGQVEPLAAAQVVARDEGLMVTMKRVGAVLKRADIPFALAGGFAAYARGGMSSDHDVDFLLRSQDVDAALEALAEAGFDTERPPEDWLVKVYDEGRLVDLIHRPVERPVTDETLADSDPISVSAIQLPVISATVLMEHRLLSFSQHYCDFAKGIPLARSLREQIDWPRVRRATAGSPYAQAFLVLLDRLDVVPLADTRLDLEGITEMIEADRRAALVPVPVSGGGRDEPAG
jgi:putative nucleotidyltransferase-like protein